MATAGGLKRNPDGADDETAITCGSLQGAGDQLAGPVEVDGGPAGNCKASAQVTPSTSPLADAGLNSLTAPGIEVRGLWAIPAIPASCARHTYVRQALSTMGATMRSGTGEARPRLGTETGHFGARRGKTWA